ncbi:MAG: UDP-N-acetylmuramoyl-tripeptide--D-alanyl-D-alanine ligase, partial [Duodenibacillus sp.]|nr:UDP-N-acetylmuramoyl-tripeptide--D-alanyl-D-alanine ligase [Duodenibacillus sp.]
WAKAKFTLCANGFVDESEVDEPTLFNMEPDTQRAECHLSVRGEHNVSNACSAAAVGIALGIPIQTVAHALSESTSESGRLETLVARDGFTVINDAYNANPDSMLAAIAVLAAMPSPRVLVMGDMAETGLLAREFHEEVGIAAREAGIDRLIATGPASKAAVQAFGIGAESVGSLAALEETAAAILAAPCSMLVKASNSAGLWKLARNLVARAAAGKQGA